MATIWTNEKLRSALPTNAMILVGVVTIKRDLAVPQRTKVAAELAVTKVNFN
jgi:hypothetical protein